MATPANKGTFQPVSHILKESNLKSQTHLRFFGAHGADGNFFNFF